MRLTVDTNDSLLQFVDDARRPWLASKVYPSATGLLTTMDVDLRNLPDMERHLIGLVEQVPKGRVTTYGRLAEALGNPIAARWVGHFLRHHPHETTCRCHRVVRAGGVLGGFVTGATTEKARLLQQDGVEVVGESVPLDRFGFDGFAGDRPLERLRDFQSRLRDRVILDCDLPNPQIVAGVDVSYDKQRNGVAGFALVDFDTAELVWSATIRRPVRFPYITSYLAFRELPLLLDLLKSVKDRTSGADVLLVDGSGIMHPRGAGIASQLGIVADIPTVGVTKKQLCGQANLQDMKHGETRPVCANGQQIGVALRHRQKSERPLFVSPGHRIDIDTAAQIVWKLSQSRSLPEPIYWADRLSRREAKATARK